jgi:cell division GTPase FtsZ
MNMEGQESIEKKNAIDVPDMPLEEYEVPPAELEAEVVNEYAGSVEFGVIGAGQCGGRIAKSFYDIGYKKTIALNTAVADLNPLQLPDRQKMVIGDSQGSGKSMLKGKRAAEDAAQRVSDKMRDVFGTVEKIIICVGFGGGTGAGSLEILIDVATKYLNDLGNSDPAKDVIVLAALPTAGELKSYTVKKNNEIIQDAMFRKAESGEVGPILLMDNSRIERLYRGIPPAKFWGTVNDTITKLFQMFNYLSKQESEYTSFDAEDYKAVLKSSGVAVMGVTKVVAQEGEQVKLSQALQDNFKKTLLARDVDYKTAKESACIVVADDKVMQEGSMDVINYGFDAIHNLVGNANLHRGLYGATKEGIRAYTLITGMKAIKSEKTSVY